MNKVLLLISLCLFASFIAASPLNHFNSLWSAWKHKHRKSYNSAEEKIRYAVFIENVKKIIKHNAENKDVTLAINQFADLSASEFEKAYIGGFKATNMSNLDMKSPSLQPRADPLPQTIDWRTLGAVTPVRNQGACDSGWAFSALGVLEGFYYIHHGVLKNFSPQQLIDCVHGLSQGCTGGWMSDAFDYTAQYGLETEDDYPYKARTQTCKYNASLTTPINTGYLNVSVGNADALKRALVDHGPVSTLIQANQAVFQFYKIGVIRSLCGYSWNHSVLVVGYGTFSGHEAFIVKNSWGSNWGNKGYVLISTNNQANKGAGVCGILQMSSYVV